MMARTNKNAKKKEVYTSMPQIRHRGIDYLTKEANNEQFHQNYSKKLDDLKRNKEETEQKIEDLELEIKRLDGEEQIANLMPANRSKLKKLIPIYRDKRKAKDDIKMMKDKLIELSAKIEKVEHMDRNLMLKENIFTAINIDLDKVKPKKVRSDFERYYDKKIDINKLKHVKRGLYLDILETANFNKLSFKKHERKYDIGQILEKERQYKQENEVRLETAAMRHKARVDMLEKRYLQMKIMRNNGEYNPIRGSLYPEELNDVDYMEYMQRASSASSVGRRIGSGKGRRI